MLLYIVRHGLTPWNHFHKAQGSADIPLAQEGIDLARRTGEALMDVKFDICFTSPLTRARQTARLVLGGRDIPVIPDKRIQEINFGVLEGHIMRTGNTMESNCEEFDLFFKDPLKFPRPENGENIQDILDRTREFWLEKTSDPSLQTKRFWCLPMDVQCGLFSRTCTRILSISGMDVCRLTAALTW